MTPVITRRQFVAMLRAAAARIRTEQARLSQLDSVIGDGDHGTTMARAMGLVEETCGRSGTTDLKGLLAEIGWAVLGVDGGAAGPLMGMLFQGMGEGLADGQEPDARGLAAMFEAGLAAVRKYTPAQVGDKTLMDALMPAVEALRAAAEAGEEPGAALARAADAAEAGAAATRDLRARLGRARNLGERSRGFQDPGATSLALVVRAMAETAAAEPA